MKQNFESNSQNEQGLKSMEAFKKADLILLAETAHGEHLETILYFLNTFNEQVKGIFFELPVDYQEDINLYITAGVVSGFLRNLIEGAKKEGKDIRSMLVLMDEAKKLGKQFICIDSSKTKSSEYAFKAPHGYYFLRGESRNEDMFENVKRYYDAHPGKYIIVVGEGHAHKGKDEYTGDNTLGNRFIEAYPDKYASAVMVSGENLDDEKKNGHLGDYNETIVDHSLIKTKK